MSIYSGFSTRSLESNYNRLIDATLRILQGRILRFYESNTEEDNVFVKLLAKNVNYLSVMEQSKYMPPKFSESLSDLCAALSIEMTVSHDLQQSSQQLSTQPSLQTQASQQQQQQQQQQQYPLDKKRTTTIPSMPSMTTSSAASPSGTSTLSSNNNGIITASLATLSPSNRAKYFQRQNSADSPTLIRIRKELQNQPLRPPMLKQKQSYISHHHHHTENIYSQQQSSAYMQQVHARVALAPQRKPSYNNNNRSSYNNHHTVHSANSPSRKSENRSISGSSNSKYRDNNQISTYNSHNRSTSWQRNNNNSQGSTSKLQTAHTNSNGSFSIQRNSSHTTSPVGSPLRNSQTRSSSSMYNPIVAQRNRSASRRVVTQAHVPKKNEPLHNFVLQRVTQPTNATTTSSPPPRNGSPTNNNNNSVNASRLSQNVWDSCSIQKEIAANYGFKANSGTGLSPKNLKSSASQITQLAYLNTNSIYNQNLIPSAAQKRTRSMLPQLMPLGGSNSSKSFLISPQKSNSVVRLVSNASETTVSNGELLLKSPSGQSNVFLPAPPINLQQQQILLQQTSNQQQQQQQQSQQLNQVSTQQEFNPNQLDLSNIEIRTYTIIPTFPTQPAN